MRACVCIISPPLPVGGCGGPASGPVPYLGQSLAQQLYLTPGVNKPAPADGERQLPGTAARGRGWPGPASPRRKKKKNGKKEIIRKKTKKGNL